MPVVPFPVPGLILPHLLYPSLLGVLLSSLNSWRGWPNVCPIKVKTFSRVDTLPLHVFPVVPLSCSILLFAASL